MYNDKYELLRSAKEHFSEMFVPFIYNLIGRPLEIEDYNNNQIVLVVPEETQSEMIKNSFMPQFQETFDFLTSKKCDNDNFQRKVDRVTRYDRDYIWGLVHDQLRQVGLSQAASDYAMIYFDHRYQYALEYMRFADRAETIAEYVFNGVLSEWTKVQRLKELKGGE